jgi:hypothetical protein
MEVVAHRLLGPEELLDRLREVRLVGHGRARVYAQADLRLERDIDVDALAVAQHYVLLPHLRRALALREALLRVGVDVLRLDGAVLVRLAELPGEEVPVLPPIVELSREPDGREVLLVNDGVHRLAAARELGVRPTVVVARGVPEHLPYYALARDGGWDDLDRLEALPEGYVKKAYRQPEGYKALFRDFNAVFPGVQAERAQTNPAWLRRQAISPRRTP